MKKENYAILKMKESFKGNWDEALSNEIENFEVIKTFERSIHAFDYFLENGYDTEIYYVGLYNPIMTHAQDCEFISIK